MAIRSAALAEPGENGPDGISGRHGDVHHAVLRLWLWSTFPVGAGGHHVICHPLFYVAATFLRLVAGQIQIWAG